MLTSLATTKTRVNYSIIEDKKIGTNQNVYISPLPKEGKRVRVVAWGGV